MSLGWQEGLRLLEQRVAALPDLLRRGAAAGLVPEFDPRGVRRVLATGVGSSAAHARYLAHLLAEHVGLDARYVPASAPFRPHPTDVLVVFSQGLSPNGRLALAEPQGWRTAVLATAVTAAPDLEALRACGVQVLGFAGGREYGTLMRVTGPMAGYVAAWRLAAAAGVRCGRPLPALDAERVAARVAEADDTLDAALEGVPLGALADGLAFLTAGTYGELVANLQYKVLEGMLLPLPPVWDLLHLAHGPLQQLFPAPVTLLALARADAAGEAELLARLARTLVPGRHRLVRLVATLPGPLAILEHEALLNALVLRWIRARHVDQTRWPGRGVEEPLYGLDRLPPARRLAALTWRELERLVAGGCRTAVLALGSTEQHGPHLPLATDTWIGDALAARVCARLPDAIALPTLALGCAREHMDFAGTLDLRPETLAAVVADVLVSLRRHGFARAFVFPAHGGNVGPLRRALPALGAAAAPLEVTAFTDWERLTAALHAAGDAQGIPAEAAGHHAGELETSIMLALRPHAVRADALAPGLAVPTAGAQALFYPSLRPHTAEGTVGDPRAADAARGRRYLEVWTEALVAAYLGAKNTR